MTRKYSSISVQTTLASGISSSATSMIVATGTASALVTEALASGNVDQFTLAIDPDTVNEEIVFVTAVSGNTLTIVRGCASTSAVSHSGGATVKHVLTSDDLNYYTAGVTTANNAIPKSTVTTKGDLVVGTAGSTVSRLGVGSNGQILTADSTQSTGVKWATVGTSSTTYTPKTASYTFVSGDEGDIFSMNNAATQAFTVPTDATYNFAVGTEFNVFWITGAGQPTISAVTPGTTTVISTGATSSAPKLRAVNSGATIKKLDTNSWIVFGDIA